jgi:hypothetical protein
LEDDEDELVDEESEDLTYADQGESLVIRRILKSTYVEKEWLQNNIFPTKCTSSGKVCNVIIDGGSCENVISTTMVEKLSLKTKPHPHPYKLQWLKRGNDIQVTKIHVIYCLVYHGSLIEEHFMMVSKTFILLKKMEPKLPSTPLRILTTPKPSKGKGSNLLSICEA